MNNLVLDFDDKEVVTMAAIDKTIHFEGTFLCIFNDTLLGYVKVTFVEELNSYRIT